MTLWSRNQRVSFSAYHCPMWRRGGLAFWENGGRYDNECLDLNACIGKFRVSLTLWQIRGVSLLLKRIPRGPGNRGFSFGWLAQGMLAE